MDKSNKHVGIDERMQKCAVNKKLVVYISNKHFALSAQQPMSASPPLSHVLLPPLARIGNQTLFAKSTAHRHRPVAGAP